MQIMMSARKTWIEGLGGIDRSLVPFSRQVRELLFIQHLRKLVVGQNDRGAAVQ